MASCLCLSSISQLLFSLVSLPLVGVLKLGPIPLTSLPNYMREPYMNPCNHKLKLRECGVCPRCPDENKLLVNDNFMLHHDFWEILPLTCSVVLIVFKRLYHLSSRKAFFAHTPPWWIYLSFPAGVPKLGSFPLTSNPNYRWDATAPTFDPPGGNF